MILKQYIDPVQCYCALDGERNPIFDSMSYVKKDCFKYSDFVVNVGLQLFIPIAYKSYINPVVKTILATNLYCGIYKATGKPELNSIRCKAKTVRQDIEGFCNTRYKVVKCELMLLTQSQHLKVKG